MLRTLLSACLALVLCGVVALAGEYSGRITKAEDNGVTFYEQKGKDKGDPKTLPVSKDVKVYSATFDPDTKSIVKGDEIKEGMKAEQLTKIGDKGVRAVVVTDKDDKTITEIRIVMKK